MNGSSELCSEWAYKSRLELEPLAPPHHRTTEASSYEEQQRRSS